MASGTLTRVCTLRGHEERVWCVAWRPRPEGALQLASCGSDRTVRLWGQRSVDADATQEDSWGMIAEIDAGERHSRTLRSLAWDLNGETLVVASFDSTTSIWQDAEGGGWQCMGVIAGHENEVKSAAISPSGEYLATCSRDKSVWIYQTSKDFEYECVAVLQSHSQDVKHVEWHPSQDILFSCSYDDTVKVWGPDGDDWACKETLSAHESTVWCMSFDVTGSHFVTCSDDRSVRIWAPASEGERPEDGKQQASVMASAFVSPLFRGALFGGGSADAAELAKRRPPANAACNWEPIANISDAHPRPVYSVDWMPYTVGGTSDLIATACGDNHVRVLAPVDAKLKSWTVVADVEAHFGDANCVAWGPSPLPGGGTALLASAGDDNEVALWSYTPGN